MSQTLAEFRAKYAGNNNEWYRLDSGEAQDLFDEALENIDRAVNLLYSINEHVVRTSKIARSFVVLHQDEAAIEILDSLASVGETYLLEHDFHASPDE